LLICYSVISNHIYGSYGTKTLSQPSHRQLVYDLSGEKHRTRLYLIFYFKGLMSTISAIMSQIQALRGKGSDFHVRGERLNAYGKESIAGFRSDLLGKDSTSACSKLFTSIPNNDGKIAAECMDHLVAGVDTTGDAMCILMWKLSTPECRSIQDKLHAELQSVADSFDTATMTAPISVLDSLPYLDSVIREGLRWRAPVPMTLFRVVPPGGREISGAKIPGGTVVGCQAYSLHRATDVYEDPDQFEPERWLTEDKEKLSLMRAFFWPFSSGARHCLGHK
jgi:cytochrome P450